MNKMNYGTKDFLLYFTSIEIEPFINIPMINLLSIAI